MSKTLKDYGWNSPWDKPYRLNLQLKQVASCKEILFNAESYESLDKVIEENQMFKEFLTIIDKEGIAFYKSKSSQFLSVFAHIRNSLSHGRFAVVENAVGNKVLLLEDVKSHKDEGTCTLTARMIIYINTLLKWIEIIEGREKEYKKNKESICD